MTDSKQFILDIKRLGINGEGIGFYNRKAVFVKNAIPGEGVNVEITKDLKNMTYAKALEWKKVSPDRVEPRCEYYEKCGACQVMHIKNEKMREFKREAIVEAISRYTTLNPKQFEIKPTITMDNPWFYRNKSTLNIRKTNGKNVIAMIEENSNRTFAVDTCMVQDDKINKINRRIIALSNEMEIKSFGDKNYSWRYLITRVSKKTRESLVTLVVKYFDDEIKEFAKSIVAKGLCDSLYININKDERTHEIFGKETIHFGGKEYITETIDKYEYRIYPTTFFQLNTKQTEVLYEETKKALKLSHKETVLDAFCGVGTIAIYIANLAKEVIGIEYNKESIEAAKINAEINKVKNASFYQGNVIKLLPEMVKNGKKFDALVFDPPRTGLGEETIKAALAAKPKRIVYVSCNPATFAKDLNLLANDYKVRYIQPVDMFPQTSLVEVVALLDAKK